jgi:hypothetical protein
MGDDHAPQNLSRTGAEKADMDMINGTGTLAD